MIRTTPKTSNRGGLINNPHSWQNTGLRKRINAKNKSASAASRHFQSDDAAGIPIGYYAVGEGDSLENEIVGLYEDQ